MNKTYIVTFILNTGNEFSVTLTKERYDSFYIGFQNILSNNAELEGTFFIDVISWIKLDELVAWYSTEVYSGNTTESFSDK